MSPTFAPTYAFSARWQRRARVIPSRPPPVPAVSAQADASSRAAEDERPADSGRSLATTPRSPRSDTPASRNAQAVPAT